jgi:hypothetical protein
VIGNYSGEVYSVNPTGSQYKFYKYDPVLGWANAPGMHGIYQRDEFRFPIRINSHGMRDRERSREAGASERIAVLGDSFTWGIGVSDEERYTNLLEQALGVEVLNFGVSGYGPLQYHLLTDEVLSFSPSVVLLAFCLGNDFGDNVLSDRYGYYQPYAALAGPSTFSIEGYPIPDIDDFGFRESEQGWLVVRMLRGWLFDRFMRPPAAGLLGYSDDLLYSEAAHSPVERQVLDQAVTINRLLLERIRDDLRNAGVELVLVSIPTKCEYSERCDNAGGLRRARPFERLRETTRALELPLVETLDTLEIGDFWKMDGHWNPRGHQKMARAIGDFLWKNDFVARP